MMVLHHNNLHLNCITFRFFVLSLQIIIIIYYLILKLKRISVCLYIKP